MTFIANIINKIPQAIEAKVQKVQATERYQHFIELPPLKRRRFHTAASI